MQGIRSGLDNIHKKLMHYLHIIYPKKKRPFNYIFIVIHVFAEIVKAVPQKHLYSSKYATFNTGGKEFCLFIKFEIDLLLTRVPQNRIFLFIKTENE